MKPNPNRMVVDMPSTHVAEDGSFVEMMLNNSDKTIQTIRFSPDTMMQFISRVFELFAHQKIQRESTQGLVTEYPSEVTKTMAKEDINHKAIIIKFHLLTGLPVSFAVQPLEAEELYKQLGPAIDKAKIVLSEYKQ